MVRSVRVGLLGCGRIAEIAHLPAYRTLRKAQLAAVADASIDRARSLAERFRVGAYFSDPMRIMEDKDIEAVDICLPTSLHSKFIMLALESGKHVFCEKPMGLSTKEADTIISKAEKSGLRLMVGYNHRFEAPFERIKEMVDSGLLGNLISMEFKYAKYGEPERYRPPSWRGDPEKGGGVLMDFGCHKIDLMKWYAGRATKVSAMAAHHLGADAEDTAQLIMNFENGSLGALSVSLVCPTHLSELDTAQLYGDRGAARFSSEHKKELEVYLRGALLGRTSGFTVLGVPSRQSSYASEIDAFIESIIQDKEPPITARDARDVIAIVEAARASIAKGVAVEVSH